MNSGPGSRPDGASSALNDPIPQAQPAGNGASQRSPEDPNSKVQDPVAHMNETDKYGLKGLSFMMNNFPDYAALVTGSDINHLGLDINAQE